MKWRKRPVEVSPINLTSLVEKQFNNLREVAGCRNIEWTETGMMFSVAILMLCCS
jgi:hypothetical protein